MENQTNHIAKLKQTLINGLHSVGMEAVLNINNDKLSMILSQISTNVNPETALQSKKLFQVEKALGYEDTFKLLVFVVKNFVDSIPVKPEFKVRSFEIFEFVDDLIKTYTHESIEDFILAFKTAKRESRKFYGAVGLSDLYEIVTDYFESQKPAYLESKGQKFKDAEVNQDLLIQDQIRKNLPELAEKLGHAPFKHMTEEEFKERIKTHPQAKKPLKKSTGIMNEKEFKAKQKQS